jgi:hypothetical protein
MKIERHPKWYYKDTEGVIHMIDITRCIICGEALVSTVIGKVMLSTSETAAKSFLHSMATASKEPDVKIFKLCGMLLYIVTVYTKLIVLIACMREQGR